MELSFSRTKGEIDRLIEELFQKAENIHHAELIREMILSALKAGQETDYLADLKMLNNTMKEMRYTNKVFDPYRQKKKVTIFGSARTDPDEPIYRKCIRFSKLLSEMGYMIITGGGPGIMQAGNEGAGSDNSFAVNIRLPFEQAPNRVMLENPRLISYKYFFTRKVAFVKESDAIAVFPGGFGTLDEAMEVFTLMLGRGFISAEDFAIFTITRDVEEAIRVIEEFYRNYHSMRFVGGKLIIRLNKELTDAAVAELESEFPEVLRPGTRIVRTSPLPEETDEPDLLHLPRLALQFDHQHYGLLIAFIGRINKF